MQPSGARSEQENKSPDRPTRQRTASPRFKKNKRALRSAEFRIIYDSGVRMTSRYFAAFCLRLQPDAAGSRFGFTTPRALGKAIKRNRMKRRMREAVRSQVQSLTGNWGVVFNPRPTVLTAPFDELCREVGRIFAQCSARCNES